MRQRAQKTLKKQDHRNLDDRVLPLDRVRIAKNVSEGDSGQKFEAFEVDFLGHVGEHVEDEVLLVRLQRGEVKVGAEVLQVAFQLGRERHAKIRLLEVVKF